jgi:hypothetical protein
MSITLTSIKNEFGHAAQDIVKVAKAIKSGLVRAGAEAPQILADIEKQAPLIEQLTSLAAPEFASIEQLAFNGLGVLAQSVEDAGAAANANGLNISLDQTLVNDIKAVLPSLKKFMSSGASSSPVAKPAAAPAAPSK